MPKSTFYNLPVEKRALIIQTALDEFAANTYSAASLSKIVEKANIAKGSMYQYFEDKADLYSYLVHYASDQKLSSISAALKGEQGDFFVLYKRIIFTAAKFDLENPLFSAFLYKAGRDSQNPQIAGMIMSASIEFLKGMLEKASMAGDIRKDVNMDLAAFLISYLSIDVGDYIGTKYGFSYHTVMETRTGHLPVTETQLEDELDQLISFLKYGIAVERPADFN